MVFPAILILGDQGGELGKKEDWPGGTIIKSIYLNLSICEMTNYNGILIPIGLMKDGKINKLIRPDYIFRNCVK